MSLNEAIRNAMLRYLQDSGIDAYEVTGWEEVPQQPYGSYCDTCGPDGPEVSIAFREISDSRIEYYTVYGTFGDFIERLTLVQ